MNDSFAEDGIVYILTNAAMPGMVKVGFTKQSLANRIAELSSSTAVPTPFAIAAYFKSAAPQEHERKSHDALKACRVRGREFFRCSVLDAVRAVEGAVGHPPEFSTIARDTSPRRLRCTQCDSVTWLRPAMDTEQWICGYCRHSQPLGQHEPPPLGDLGLSKVRTRHS